MMIIPFELHALVPGARDVCAGSRTRPDPVPQTREMGGREGWIEGGMDRGDVREETWVREG